MPPTPSTFPALATLAMLLLATCGLGLPLASADSQPCPSVLVAGARTPPRLAASGVVATADVEGQPALASAADSAIFPAPTVQTVPAFLEAGTVEVVLTLDVVSDSAMTLSWAFSKVDGIDPLDTRVLTCDPIAGAADVLTVPAPPTIGLVSVPGNAGATATYVVHGPFVALNFYLTEQGTGVVAWSVTTIPLATPCVTILDPACPTS